MSFKQHYLKVFVDDIVKLSKEGFVLCMDIQFRHGPWM